MGTLQTTLHHKSQTKEKLFQANYCPLKWTLQTLKPAQAITTVQTLFSGVLACVQIDSELQILYKTLTTSAVGHCNF